MAKSRNRDTVKKYVGDMVALESHIEEALDRQVEQVKDHPKARQAVNRFHTMVKNHRDGLKQHLEGMGGEEGSPLKTAVASAFGVAAGVVDKVRPEAVSKALRDDYTAFNHAAIGYHMLYGTALMLGERSTAAIAERHHRAYADAVQDINQIVLDVVAWELEKDGHTVDETAMDRATDTMNQDWQSTAPTRSGHASTRGRATGTR
jgi:ferritin-like metal-binding protein YciE